MIRTAEHNGKISASLLARGVGASTEKVCPRCRKSLPRSEFEIRWNGHTDSYCAPCERAYNAERQRQYVRAHPELRTRIQRCNRRVKLKRFGLSLEQYEAMVEQQNGLCAICMQPPRNGRALDVDHCHKSQRVRGLLCSPCNLMIGLVAESVEHLAAMVAYLSSQRRP